MTSVESLRIPVGVMCVLYGFAAVFPAGLFTLAFIVAAGNGALLGIIFFLSAFVALIASLTMFCAGIGILLNPPRGISALSMASSVMAAASILYFFVSVFTLYPPVLGIVIYFAISAVAATPPILAHLWCNKAKDKGL